MAGQNRVLKDGELLFKMGDPAESMYIVRRGLLKVFIPKPTEELILAELHEGSIVGEMAFFDEKPRSASVKACGSAEVTAISRGDFDKLLQQVPKWMVSMMQSLVGRLRSTNERVQHLEAQSSSTPTGLLPNQKHPYQHVLRALQILLLAQAKDGEKDGKDLVLAREIPTRLWMDLSGEEQGLFDKIVEILSHSRMLVARSDARRTPSLVFVSRGTLAGFTEFLSSQAKTFSPGQTFISPAAMGLLAAISETVESSGYESLNISFKKLCADAPERGWRPEEWHKGLKEIMTLPGIKAVPIAGDAMFRVVLKEHKQLLVLLKTLKMFADAGLA